MGGDIEKYLGLTLDQFNTQGNTVGFMVQAMHDIHLHSTLSDDLSANGSIQYVYLFGATAIFIILLACINFMNLSTARSANRAKEVGIRKTIGALRQRLIGQFLMESYIYYLCNDRCHPCTCACFRKLKFFQSFNGKGTYHQHDVFTLFYRWAFYFHRAGRPDRRQLPCFLPHILQTC